MLGGIGPTWRHCLKGLAIYAITGLGLAITSCSGAPGKTETVAESTSPPKTPFPFWGVALLSWDAGQLPTAVSWKPQTWIANYPQSCGSLGIRMAAITGRVKSTMSGFTTMPCQSPKYSALWKAS